MTSEAEPVWECLQTGGFAYRKGAVLCGVYVPVPVFRDVGRDGPGDLVPSEAFVLIVEDVGAVPSQPGGEVGIGIALLEQRKRLSVICSYISCAVIPDEPPRVSAQVTARPRLE